MKYRLFIKITIDDYPYFIELAKDYELSIHFNLTDKLWIDGFFCDITEIFHNIDDNETWLKLDVTDPKAANIKSKKSAIDSLRLDVEELKEYGWYLNDYDLGKEKVDAISQRKES